MRRLVPVVWSSLSLLILTPSIVMAEGDPVAELSFVGPEEIMLEMKPSSGDQDVLTADATIHVRNSGAADATDLRFEGWLDDGTDFRSITRNSGLRDPTGNGDGRG
jgi:uncharacterized repeat protein (TIGR01451 family)